MIELLRMCNMVDKKEIEKAILNALGGPSKGGLITKELKEKIGIEGSTDERKFYTVLESLRCKKILKHINQDKKRINYLPKFERKVMMERGLDKKDVKLNQELEKIEAGFVIVEKGVITQREGEIRPLKSEEGSKNQNETIFASGPLDFMINEKDDADFLIFSVENHNKYPIKGIGANIYVSDIFYRVGDYRVVGNCQCIKNGNAFHVKCDELYPMMMAYVVIPLFTSIHKYIFKDKKKEKEFYSEREPCDIEAWYKTKDFKVRGGRISKLISHSYPVIKLMGENCGLTVYF